jgi:hypothetical protein
MFEKGHLLPSTKHQFPPYFIRNWYIYSVNFLKSPSENFNVKNIWSIFEALVEIKPTVKKNVNWVHFLQFNFLKVLIVQ